MKFSEIIGGESETVEYKEGFGKEAIESAVSMTTTNGGYVLIGVRDVMNEEYLISMSLNERQMEE